MASDKTVALTKDNFEEELKSGYVLVDFWAEWCTPCKMLNPIIDEIAEEMSGKLKVASLDVDSNPELSQQFGVQSIPTIILFKDGQPVDRSIGAVPKDNLVSFIQDNMTGESESESGEKAAA